MTRWAKWRAQYGARLGPAGLCGIIIAMAGVATHAGFVQPRASELAALAMPAAGASSLATSAPDTGAAAARFAAGLPGVDSLPDWLERIEAAAAAAGVTLERTEYRVADEAAAGIARYQIMLPLKGAYPQVRAFAAALLETVPALAITGLDLKRETVSAAAIEARIDVALYLKAATAKAIAANGESQADDAASGTADAAIRGRPAARRSFPAAAADLFAARSWAPQAAVKVRAPVAPPLPYTYFGRITEDGTLRVFLQRGPRTYTAALGDVLDRDYRVEEISSDAVILTYLPLAQRQMLHTGSPPR